MENAIERSDSNPVAVKMAKNDLGTINFVRLIGISGNSLAANHFINALQSYVRRHNIWRFSLLKHKQHHNLRSKIINFIGHWQCYQ